MDRWMDGWKDRWRDGQMDSDRQMDSNRQMDGWIDGRVDGWMDGWMDGQMNKQKILYGLQNMYRRYCMDYRLCIYSVSKLDTAFIEGWVEDRTHSII